jgi:DNA-binding CsgD family transcriptional regulator
VFSYEVVLDLVDCIYSAAQNATSWPSALEALGSATGSDAASLLYHNLQSHEGGVDVAVRVNPEARAEYDAHYHRLDPWGNSPKTPMMVGPGAILDGDQLVPRAELHRTEYYNDFAKAHDLTRVLAGTIIVDGPVVSVVSLIRGERSGPHGSDERRILEAVMPHLCRAMQMHGLLAPANAGDLYSAAMETLDRLSTGVVLVTADARALFVNRAAERMLRRRDGLTVDRGSLVAMTAHEREALRFLVRRAARQEASDALHAGGALSISRPSGRRPYYVLVSPLNRGYAPGGSLLPAVGIFVTDPEERLGSSAELLMRLFHLTEAEARLAALVGTGTLLGEAADAIGIPRDAARMQLKSIFVKTGTCRQGELVRLISRACPLLPGETHSPE